MSKRLVKSPKLYFYDTGLAARLLGLEKKEHVENHPLKGNLFENLVVGEILKFRYNRALPDNLYFYRDSKGNEVDIVYEIGGRPFPIEIKSAETIHPDFFGNIRYFNNIIPKSGLSGEGMLIYGGDRIESRNNISVIQPEYIESFLTTLLK